ncbi:GroES-like protein [Cylindrobasidium torrendii FP15055 ss-10]|uniref:L-arabinitol 4-dehydrogenase n=1 Tax=Cylindrobasidium torrendii FP15055 ss-10 TaxID=1314674 RepID=A0A0D7BTN9_9AGAR|nr:GroES-like protein [Cylindrobasidium torrendii FP15055 ss-10]
MSIRPTFEELYDPRRTLDSPSYKILGPNDKPTEGANIGLFINNRRDIHLAEMPKPSPAPGHVLVRMRATGICGSDVHLWHDGRIGHHVVNDDMCVGHEPAGEIVELGEGVTQWKVGDRVALEAGIPCFLASCEQCRLGRYNGCPVLAFIGVPPWHGALTRWHVHPQEWCHRLPDNVSYEEGALCEPLTVALSGIQESGIMLGDPTLIGGAGPIGLATLLAARAAGAEPIVITDLHQSRLDVAKSIVPTVKTVLIDPSVSQEDQAKKIVEAAGQEISVALECTGFEGSIGTAAFCLRYKGCLTILGVGRSIQSYPFMRLSLNEMSIKFVNRYANQHARAIRLVSGGVIDLKPLVTHRYKIEDALEAFRVAADPKQGAIKVHIQDLS